MKQTSVRVLAVAVAAAGSVAIGVPADAVTTVVKPCASTFQAVKDTAPAFTGGPTGAVAPKGQDVWVVGNDLPPNEPAARHWDGTSWARVSLPNTGLGEDRLQGVTDAAPDDLWAVGSSDTGHSLSRSTLIEHFDGTAWTIFPAAPATMVFNELEGVAAVTPDDVWAVGDQSDGSYKQGGLAEHFNGKTWRTLPTPQDGGLLLGVSAVAGDIWAVGFTGIIGGTAPRIEHSTGGPFRTVASPVPVGSLLAVAEISPSDVWAVGQKGPDGNASYELIEHYDGTSWTIAATPQILGTTLTAVTAVSPTDVWATGTTRGATNQVVILHWDGTTWSTVAPAAYPDAEFPAAMAITHSRSRVWIIGENQNQRNVTPDKTDTSQEHCA